MRSRALTFAVTLGSALASALAAHEVRPAYLEIRETGGETYELEFKVPAKGEDLRLGLDVELPARCAPIAEPRPRFSAGAFVESWSVRCPGGLAGEAVRIAGLEATMTDALARVERSDGAVQSERLTPAAPSFVIEASPSRFAVVSTYLVLGVEHILGGFDHLLFVLALVMLVRGGRRLVATITAFTAAHSLTLSAASLGLVSVPIAPVEATIALSIAFVAAEIVHGRRGRPGLTASRPWLVAFAFGLLHGLGFASALAEIGLPHGAIPLALACFNVGVEIGQLLFVGAALAGLEILRRRRVSVPRWAELATPYAIGGLAMFWTIERLAALL
jgi:hydrogenase/urease accessory protein HupE